jgi:uncharacterized protein YbjT (DUF2867 family)
MILVTGASETLGKEIAKQLLQSKKEFRCLVRPTSKTDELPAYTAANGKER